MAAKVEQGGDDLLSHLGGPQRPTLMHFLKNGTFMDTISPISTDILARKLWMYKQAMENLQATGRFVSMHGGGIDHTAGWGSNQPSAFQVPPGQIAVLVAPRGTVVHGNEQQDTANWLFFKQFLWPIAGTVGGETSGNCYGTNPYPSAMDRDEERSKTYSADVGTDEAEYAVLVSLNAKQKGKSVAERVKSKAVIKEQNKKAAAKKFNDAKEEAVEKAQQKKGGVGELDWNAYLDDPFWTPGANTKVNADGKELLWHMQIFYGGDAEKYGKDDYDGDWVYNQWQLFEMEPTGGFGSGGSAAVNIDEDFNNYIMGNPLCHMKDAFESGEFPVGASLPVLDGQEHHHIPTATNMAAVDDAGEQAHANELYALADSEEALYLQTPYRRGSDGKFYKYTGPFQHANFIAPEFNNRTANITKTAFEANNPWGTAGVHRNIHTTEHIIKKHYQERNGTPGITFFSSCSPHKGTEKRIGNTSKTALSNMANLTLRKHLYNLGRANFCSLRGNLLNPTKRAQWASGCSSTLPQYDQHKGITKMAKDDREEFYITVGNYLRAVQEGRALFTPDDFETLYLEAKQSAPGGELMSRLKQIYDRWYSATLITRGIYKGSRWNSIPSITTYGLLPFEEEINYLEIKKRNASEAEQERKAWWASADGIAKTAEIQQMHQGGGRKRRRKKTKRRRKKKIKSRRKRKTRRRRKKRTRRRKKQN